MWKGCGVWTETAEVDWTRAEKTKKQRQEFAPIILFLSQSAAPYDCFFRPTKTPDARGSRLMEATSSGEGSEEDSCGPPLCRHRLLGLQPQPQPENEPEDHPRRLGAKLLLRGCNGHQSPWAGDVAQKKTGRGWTWPAQGPPLLLAFSTNGHLPFCPAQRGLGGAGASLLTGTLSLSFSLFAEC